jgi:hypothetical protein
VGDKTSKPSKTIGPIISKPQFFHTGRTYLFIFLIFSATVIFIFIKKAAKGEKLYIRPISGINAIDEAIGRATEMGKPILYVPGLSAIYDISTLASLSILSGVAKKVAEYDTRIIVPNYDPVVFTVCQEVVKEAFLQAGKPEAYKEDDIFFLAGRQFAYAAAVSGIIVREKPATNFFLGAFFAESLLLAETGATTGAIQIAGTDYVMQIPFFIAACDYTLIGEELYAAGAYIGKQPDQLGSLKGQDWTKTVVIGGITLGFIFSILDIFWDAKIIDTIRQILLTLFKAA